MSPAINIAIVDDHPIVVAGLVAMFANDDEISVVATGATLRGLAESLFESPDVLLLDLNIPGETYVENIAVARERWTRTKIAAYTSYQGVDLIRETLKLGCGGYLLKGDSHEAMREGLRNIVAGKPHVSEVVRKPVRRRDAKGTSLRDDFQKGLLLSKREKEVLFHLCKGLTSQQMAKALFISRYTVETHRKNILRKLDFSSSTELVKFAVEQGLV